VSGPANRITEEQIPLLAPAVIEGADNTVTTALGAAQTFRVSQRYRKSVDEVILPQRKVAFGSCEQRPRDAERRRRVSDPASSGEKPICVGTKVSRRAPGTAPTLLEPPLRSLTCDKSLREGSGIRGFLDRLRVLSLGNPLPAQTALERTGISQAKKNPTSLRGLILTACANKGLERSAAPWS